MPATASLLADKLCPAVLYSLDENSPSVCRPVWESALSVLTAVPVGLLLGSNVSIW
jgi:hypothetical protein